MGEDLALLYFVRRGSSVLARNWRSPVGELDLVMKEGETVVFVEVKTRGEGSIDYLLDSLSPRKQQKLRVLAECFLKAHFGWREMAHRIDVLGVEIVANRVSFRHLVGAV